MEQDKSFIQHTQSEASAPFPLLIFQITGNI